MPAILFRFILAALLTALFYSFQFAGDPLYLAWISVKTGLLTLIAHWVFKSSAKDGGSRFGGVARRMCMGLFVGAMFIMPYLMFATEEQRRTLLTAEAVILIAGPAVAGAWLALILSAVVERLRLKRQAR